MNFENALCVKNGSGAWLSENADDQELARLLCLGCPVAAECAAYAQVVKPTCGVWAGQSVGRFISDHA